MYKEQENIELYVNDDAVNQEQANFFYKEPDSKYFWFYGL